MTNKTAPIAVRLDEHIAERLDVLSGILSEAAGGAEVSRSNVVRVAIERGIEALEKEFDVVPSVKRPKLRRK